MYKNRQAFTLIELLVVVLIIGILAAVAVPQYRRVVEKSKVVQILALLKPLADAEEAYYLANGKYTPTLSKLDVSVPVPISEKAQSITLDNGVFLSVGQAWNMIYGITEHVKIEYFLKHSTYATYAQPDSVMCLALEDDSIGTSICKSLSNDTKFNPGRIWCPADTGAFQSAGMCQRYIIRS